MADVPYDRNLPVFTFWDLGKGTSDKSTDAMVCWFLQFPDSDYPSPKKVHVIDCHHSRGQDWAYYAQMLNQKGYWYGNHFAPWDIQSGKAGWGMKTNLDLARERGLNFVPVKRTPAVYNDIELMRRWFSDFYFSDKHEVVKGAEMIASYHEKLNKDGLGTGKPEHDASSNYADGFRCFIRAKDLEMITPSSERSNGFGWADNINLSGYFD